MNSTSLKKLATAHPDLIALANEVDAIYPIQVICGYRSKEDQEKAFSEGKSKLKAGESKHNMRPARAIDCAPDPDRNPATISWADLKEFEIMCLAFEAKAEELGIKIRLGRDFSFKDWPHIELVT